MPYMTWCGQYSNYGGLSGLSAPGRKSTDAHLGVSQSIASLPGFIGKTRCAALRPAKLSNATKSNVALALLPGVL